MSKTRPNILFIMPDQLRADFLSCYGAGFIKTPHIDSLAQRGTRYTDAVSPSPMCMPARAALLTGMNAIHNGVVSNSQFLRPDLSSCGVKTWPEHLNDAGYRTAAMGKMHFSPWDCSMGFQERVICEDKRAYLVKDDYHDTLKELGLRKYHGNEHAGYFENKGAIVSKLPLEHQPDSFTADAAVRYIHNHDGKKPFAMMVAFPGPHCPYDPLQEYLDQFDPKDMPVPVPIAADEPEEFVRDNVEGNRAPWNGVDYADFSVDQKLKLRAHYAALVKQIDDQVGEILRALEEAGEMERTLIIFSSDHGDFLGDHGMVGKSRYYESAIKVPLIVAMPATTVPAIWEAPVSIEDITATMLLAGGCELPSYYDSQALPQLGLEGEREPRRRICGFMDWGSMIYDGTWKLCKYREGVVQLFNVREDPGEQRNRIADPACLQKYVELDGALSAQLHESLRRGSNDLKVAPASDDGFVKRGWKRPYPLAL